MNLILLGADDQLLIGLSCILSLIYFALPLCAYFKSRILAEPTAELIDGKCYPLPPRFRERVEHDSRQLEALGFVPTYSYTVRMTVGSAEVVSISFRHPESHISAAIIGSLLLGANGCRLIEMYTALASEYQIGAGITLLTDNQDPLIDLGLRERDVTRHFPHVAKLERLLELHQMHEKREFSNETKDTENNPDTPAELQKLVESEYREIIADWALNGRIERVRNEVNYRLPLWTMYQVCWGKLPPFSLFWKWSRARRFRQFERELLQASK